MTATMKQAVFWEAMPCSLVENYWHFKGTQFNFGDGTSQFLLHC